MKFVQLLNEKWYKSEWIKPNYGNSLIVDIFVNPSQKEIRDIHKESELNKYMNVAIYNQYVRYGITDEKKPKLYAWDGEITHDLMYKKVKFNFGFIQKSPTELLSIEHKINDLRYIDEVLKTIGKYFPKAKTVECEYGYTWDLKTRNIAE